MILPYQLIKQRCIVNHLITPYKEREKAFGMSLGCGPASYDVRIAEDIELTGCGTKAAFSLASTIEHFQMPDDLIAFVHDKSSWARLGLDVKNTVIDPGWHGFLTLELSNNRCENILHIKAGMPIAQIVFCQLIEPTTMCYNGKYQDQRAGAVPAILES